MKVIWLPSDSVDLSESFSSASSSLHVETEHHNLPWNSSRHSTLTKMLSFSLETHLFPHPPPPPCCLFASVSTLSISLALFANTKISFFFFTSGLIPTGAGEQRCNLLQPLRHELPGFHTREATLRLHQSCQHSQAPLPQPRVHLTTEPTSSPPLAPTRVS